MTYENHIEMREGIGRRRQPGQQLLSATEKSMESWVGRISFVAAITYLLLFEIYIRGLHRAGIVPLSKHVTHYCQQSRYRYCNLTTLPTRGIPYRPPRDTLSSSAGCSPGHLHQYPADVLKFNFIPDEEVSARYNKRIVTCIPEIKIRLKILVTNMVIKKVPTLPSSHWEI
jgi:hypothetical protein